MLLKGSNPTNATTAAGVAQFLYNTTTGALSIDKNGSTADGVELIATLANKANITLSHLSIEVSDLFVA
jgi:hypothetical protein